MKLGLIARADRSGLAVQTHEFYRHMQPDRVLVIDVGHMRNDTTHCNKTTDLSKYANPMVFSGWAPDREVFKQFMAGLDVVFSAECFYGDVPTLANRYDVKTVLAPNFEFYDPRVPADLLAAPSMWRFDEYQGAKTFLPVPIPTDRFTVRSLPDTALDFLHVVGRPAVHDRNGTMDLLEALRFVESDINVRICCQDATFLQPSMMDRIPRNVCIVLDHGDTPNYWDNYFSGDVLVMPRRFGGLCLPVLEAIGAGMSAIMPDISPNTWLPADWLVPATHAGSFKAKQHVDLYTVDHRALAHKIDTLASDPGFYAKAKQEAAELRDQLSWTALKPRYEEVLNGL